MMSREFHTGATMNDKSQTGQSVTTLQNIGTVPFQKALLSLQLYTACNNTILIRGSNFSSRLQIHILDSGALWPRDHLHSPPFSETKCISNFK